jgi:hypothetical protein
VQQAKDGIGDRADPYLQNGSICDVARHEPRDRLIGIADRRGHELHRRACDLHGVVDPRSGKHDIAVRERHALVYLGDDDSSLRDRRVHEVVDQAEAVIAVGVRWADLHKGNVATDQPLLDERPDLADIARDDGQPMRRGEGA